MTFLITFVIVAAVLLLLRHDVGPVLVYRPLVLGPLLGSMAGIPLEGFLVGSALEWIWIDRIPAGGIRIPAVSVGTAAALTALIVLTGLDTAPRVVHGDQLAVAMLVAAGYTLLYVPLDGGLRRAWNIAGENTILAIGQGSLVELRAFVYVTLAVRVALLAVGLLTAPVAALGLDEVLHRANLRHVLDPFPWAWTIPAAMVAFLLRTGNRRTVIGGIGFFLAGMGVVWSR